MSVGGIAERRSYRMLRTTRRENVIGIEVEHGRRPTRVLCEVYGGSF